MYYNTFKEFSRFHPKPGLNPYDPLPSKKSTRYPVILLPPTSGIRKSKTLNARARPESLLPSSCVQNIALSMNLHPVKVTGSSFEFNLLSAACACLLLLLFGALFIWKKQLHRLGKKPTRLGSARRSKVPTHPQ